MTPFEEGRVAGFKNLPNVNPYRNEAAKEWEDGYAQGQHEGRDEVSTKRVAFAKGWRF